MERQWMIVCVFMIKHLVTRWDNYRFDIENFIMLVIPAIKKALIFCSYLFKRFGMNPDEAEFLGEKQLVSIIPTFNNGVIHLISGDVGPFRASLPVNVPLWFAVHMKQQQKCKVQPPDWMEVDRLEAVKEDEKTSRTFTKMPSEHYMVEAKLLLGCASDDIPRADEIRTIIKDIWDIRMSKLRSSVNKLVKNTDSYAGVDNLTIMEINSIRPILPHALDQIYRIKAAKRMPGTQSQGTTTFLSTTGRPSTSFTS